MHRLGKELTGLFMSTRSLMKNWLQQALRTIMFFVRKVFKKNGLGPRNGSFVEALFDEADWASDDIDIARNHIISSQCNGPTYALALPEKQSLSVGPGINDPGSTSAYCPLFPMGPSTSQVLVDEPDAEMERLSAWFLDCNVNDTLLPLNDNGNLKVIQGNLTRLVERQRVVPNSLSADLIGKGKNIVLPGFDGNDINTSTNVQAYQTQINEAGIDFSVMQKDGLLAPLNFSAVVGGTEQFQMCDRVGSYFNENMQGGNLSGAAHYASCMDQLPLLLEESEFQGFVNVAQLENDNYYHGSDTAYASDFSGQPPVPPEESNMADSFLNVVQMEMIIITMDLMLRVTWTPLMDNCTMGAFSIRTWKHVDMMTISNESGYYVMTDELRSHLLKKLLELGSSGEHRHFLQARLGFKNWNDFCIWTLPSHFSFCDHEQLKKREIKKYCYFMWIRSISIGGVNLFQQIFMNYD